MGITSLGTMSPSMMFLLTDREGPMYFPSVALLGAELAPEATQQLTTAQAVM